MKSSYCNFFFVYFVVFCRRNSSNVAVRLLLFFWLSFLHSLILCLCNIASSSFLLLSSNHSMRLLLSANLRKKMKKIFCGQPVSKAAALFFNRLFDAVDNFIECLCQIVNSFSDFALMALSYVFIKMAELSPYRSEHPHAADDLRPMTHQPT